MPVRNTLPNDPIVIILRGKVIPAQRPRVDNGKAHYSEAYSTWRKIVKAALTAAIGSFPATISRHFPLTGVKVEVEFHGCNSLNADLDNLIKGCIDAMVKAEILAGDTVRKVNEMNPKYFDADYPVAAILIYPNWQPVSKINPQLLQPPPGDRAINPSSGNKVTVRSRTTIKKTRTKT